MPAPAPAFSALLPWTKGDTQLHQRALASERAALCLARDERARCSAGMPGILSISCEWRVPPSQRAMDATLPWNWAVLCWAGLGWATLACVLCRFRRPQTWRHALLQNGISLAHVGDAGVAREWVPSPHLPPPPPTSTRPHVPKRGASRFFCPSSYDPSHSTLIPLLSLLLFTNGLIDCLFSLTISCLIAAIERVKWGGRSGHVYHCFSGQNTYGFC